MGGCLRAGDRRLGWSEVCSVVRLVAFWVVRGSREISERRQVIFQPLPVPPSGLVWIFNVEEGSSVAWQERNKKWRDAEKLKRQK